MVWVLRNVSDWPKLKSVYNSCNKIFNNFAICLIPILQYTLAYTVLTLDYFNIPGKLHVVGVSPLLFTQGWQLKFFYCNLKISLTPNILDFYFYHNKLCQKDNVWLIVCACVCRIFFPWTVYAFLENMILWRIQTFELLDA